MFYSITGKIVYIDTQSVAIETGGVAFRCSTTLTTLKRIGEKGSTATLYTYLNVREDALDLFGFADEQELECFKLLIGVSGVGPKAALAILSELTPDKLALCLATGDSKAITRAPGVGPKLAQRVVLELKDKLAKGLELSAVTPEIEAAGIAAAEGSAAEAVSALTMLGYSQSEAAAAVAKLDASLSVEDMIRQALKTLARQV
ncbi:MAG TPA: Holliday junction branch migration protein RuvA [Candidatus Fimenecus stercoravium]|nr:Holliday junction branch migration protein RuvA [Candidatus Fimenecus stercoravium]